MGGIERDQKSVDIRKNEVDKGKTDKDKWVKESVKTCQRGKETWLKNIIEENIHVQKRRKKKAEMC